MATHGSARPSSRTGPSVEPDCNRYGEREHPFQSTSSARPTCRMQISRTNPPRQVRYRSRSMPTYQASISRTIRRTLNHIWQFARDGCRVKRLAECPKFMAQEGPARAIVFLSRQVGQRSGLISMFQQPASNGHGTQRISVARMQQLPGSALGRNAKRD
jgi:hypothetical protein